LENVSKISTKHSELNLQNKIRKKKWKEKIEKNSRKKTGFVNRKILTSRILLIFSKQVA